MVELETKTEAERNRGGTRGGLAKAVTEEEKEAKIYAEREKLLDEQREPVLDEPDYESDSSDAVCPKCKHSERQEICDMHNLKDGDSWEWVCPNCGASCTIGFCVSYTFTTTLNENKEVKP